MEAIVKFGDYTVAIIYLGVKWIKTYIDNTQVVLHSGTVSDYPQSHSHLAIGLSLADPLVTPAYHCHGSLLWAALSGLSHTCS